MFGTANIEVDTPRNEAHWWRFYNYVFVTTADGGVSIIMFLVTTADGGVSIIMFLLPLQMVAFL